MPININHQYFEKSAITLSLIKLQNIRASWNSILDFYNYQQGSRLPCSLYSRLHLRLNACVVQSSTKPNQLIGLIELLFSESYLVIIIREVACPGLNIQEAS